MKRLYITEGLPCSGKSTVSAFVSDILKQKHKVCYVDEGSGDHPADHEFHAYLSEADFHAFTDAEQTDIRAAAERKDNGYIVPLSAFGGEMFDKLLQFKIYDFLPWETEYPVMLDKWKSFAENADSDTVYVFNCVFLQNPMCETMMRFGLPFSCSMKYISAINEIIRPMKPLIIYLKNDDVRSSVIKASAEREGWLDGVIDYHVNGAYGKSINASGFDGYIACLEERQKRELEILSQLDAEHIIIDNPQRDWDKTYNEIRRIIS